MRDGAHELIFVTGNPWKLAEAQALLPRTTVIQKKLELPEVQSLDPVEVVRHKLESVVRQRVTECIVEDSSLSFACLGDKLPGPFIASFEEALGVEGLYVLTQKYGDDRAAGRTMIGYADADGTMHVFEGVVEGRIVAPRGDKDFGYGAAFMPSGSNMTFEEMEREEKYARSSRGAAFLKLREYLDR
ncbi:MAG TPA: non-canonical purine NTP pyrophosphatase [Candidatus Paceibacterota bacterium]|nr:non-canonical purine NTP pyrophosphatase [Candidatus Paceibacterota bacterium]